MSLVTLTKCIIDNSIIHNLMRNRVISCIKVFISLLFVLGCNKQESNNNDLVTVSFALRGDITVDVEAITKALTSDDLCAIQVLEKESENNYMPYACGVFDNSSDIKLELIPSNDYLFRCVVIKNGKNHQGDFPFLKISRKSDYNLNEFYKGYQFYNTEAIHCYHNHLVFYYGETTLSNAKNGDVVQIEMKIQTFFVRYSYENVISFFSQYPQGSLYCYDEKGERVNISEDTAIDVYCSCFQWGKPYLDELDFGSETYNTLYVYYPIENVTWEGFSWGGVWYALWGKKLKRGVALIIHIDLNEIDLSVTVNANHLTSSFGINTEEFEICNNDISIDIDIANATVVINPQV